MRDPDTTERLVTRARQGDQEALAELFEGYRGNLKQMVRLRLNQAVLPRVAVSDVLQEAYVDLANQLDNYAKDPKLPFFLWLRRITQLRLAKIHRTHLGQEMRNVARERRLDQQAVPGVSAILMANQLVGQLTSVSEKAIRNENRSRMEVALENLSETDREILALRHIEQLSNGDIAIELAITESAATNRYVRAIRRLRDALGEP